MAFVKCTKETLEEVVKERYGSVPKMAKAIGMSEQTIYTCLKGCLIGSYFTTSMPIIAALDLDPFSLLEGNLVSRSERDRSFINVPLYGSVSAGSLEDPDEVEDLIPIPAEKHRDYPNAFLLKVSGRSMNLTFPDGVFVLVDPCESIDYPGEPYVVYSSLDGATIKRAYPMANGLQLVPHSSDTTMRTITYDFASPSEAEVRVIGRAVWATYPLDWRFDPNVR